MKKFIISLLVGSLALGASAADTDENPIATVSQLPGYCTIFHQWGFIGDSLCSGEHESLDEQGHKGYHDYYDYSWGQRICRACGTEFTWTSGHSGQVLSEDVANRLETLWFDYLYLNPRLNNGTSAAANIRNVNLISPILRRYLNASRGNNCEKCNYNYQKIWGENCQLENPYRCSLPAPELRGKDGDNFLHNVHCICGNCYQAIMYGCNDINEKDKEFEETLIYDSWPKKEKNNC